MALEVKKKYPVPRTTRPYHTLPQRTLKREQRRTSLRKLGSGAMTLMIVAGVAGLLYTWYMGQQRTALASQPAPVYQPRAELKPHKVASDAVVGASVQTISQEVRPGENAALTIRTNPEVECSIVVKYGEVVAVDGGLVAKLADEFGVASWSWTVPNGTPTGVWPATVTCKNKKHSAVVEAKFSVK